MAHPIQNEHKKHNEQKQPNGADKKHNRRCRQVRIVFDFREEIVGRMSVPVIIGFVTFEINESVGRNRNSVELLPFPDAHLAPSSLPSPQ